MANKDDINVSSGYDDFGDFDFNIDESGTKKDQVAQPSKIRTDYIPSMKSGFVEGLKRELASKMPYTAAAVDQVSSIYNEAKNMTQQFAAEATPLVRSIGRSTNRLMPLVRPFMPKGVYDKITGKLSQIPDEQGELSEEEKQSQQISADINAAFQGSDANAQVRSNMENVIGGMRHKATMGALGGLLNQMQTTNKFLTTSLMAYMKKDLELQYRQLYTQRDIASTLRGTAKVLEAELKNITHNSGLPDMIKAKDFQRRTTKMDKVRDYTANFWKNLMGNFKENVVNQLKSALEGVEMATSGAADMKEMMEEMEGQPLSLKTLAFKGLFNLGGRMLGSKLTGKIAKMGQTALGGFDSIFENFNNNFIRGIENYSRKDNMLGNLLSMFIPQRPENNTKVQNALSKNPTQPVQFDISTREAIVTIIPGYLAKLNKLVEDIKDPSKQHEELVYSTDERQFVTRGALNEKAEDVIDKFINPEVYGATDHLAVVTTGQAIQGRTGNQISKWFEKKEKDGEGRTNRELVELFFQNIVRSERHELDVKALDSYLKDKDIDTGVVDYVQMATDGLGGAARRIVRYILGSLKRSDGDWNNSAIRKYQKALDNAAPYYDTNAITEKFSAAMNDMSEEKRERIFAILEDRGLYDRKKGELKLGAMNKLTASKRANIELGDAVNSWSARSAIEAMSREEAFTVNGGLEHFLDSANGFMTNVAKDAQAIGDRTKKQLGTIWDKGKARLGNLTGNWARGVFGNEMTEAFKLMSGAMIDRYKKANGVATVALDLALISSDFPESDLQLIRDFAEESMEEKDPEKIAKMRLGVIASIKNEDLVNIFSEATAGITTQKDAINHFGTMKQRINMLQQEEVFKAASDTLKAKLTDVKNKGKKVKGFFTRTKDWLTGKVKEIREEVKAEEEAEKKAKGATPESVEATTAQSEAAKPSLVERAKTAGDKLVEKAKAAGKSISEAVDETTGIKSDINEVLVKGLDEYKVHVSAMDENVARIYTLLEKKLGNLTEEEITELRTKAQKLKDEMAAQSEAAKSKKSFGKKLKGLLSGAVGVLNPFKSFNAAKIAAKYQLDTTPESAFHADFQTYFAYRKEMDVCMASIMSHRNILTSTVRGALSGAGKIIGGTVKGLGYAGKGLYTAGGKILGGALPALGYLGGGLFHGGAVLANGAKDIAFSLGRRSWEFTKDAIMMGKRTLFGAGPSKPTEQWYDLYRKDEVGEKGWEKRPFLSAHTQKKGIYHIGPDGKSTGKILKTDDIAGPVMNAKGKQLINEDDWKIGFVNIEGKSISQKAKEHGSGALIQLGGGSLLGGLFSGLGSLLGGGLKGGGTVLAKLLGINWDITKMFGSGLKKAGSFIKGIGSNIAASLGIGTSEKAQRKKYSVIIGEFEKVNKTLEAIRTEGLPTKKKKVAGDKDGDGDRDGSYEDQVKQEEEKKEKRSFRSMLLGLVGKEEKDGKVVKKKFEDTWFGKAINWVKNPKNWVNAAILGAGAFIVHHFVKKYGAKTVIEAVTNAVIKTSEVVVGIAQGVGWIVDKAIDIWKWLKKKFGWDDDQPTPEQLAARQNLIAAQAAAHALRPGGGIVKGPKDVTGSISRAPAAKPNVPEVPKAPATPETPAPAKPAPQETPKPGKGKGKPRGRGKARNRGRGGRGPRAKAPTPPKAPAPGVGVPGAAGVPAPASAVPKGKLPTGVPKGPAVPDIGDAVQVLDKVDDAGDAAKTGRPMLEFFEKIWTKAKEWCSGTSFKMHGKGSAAVKNSSVGKYFDRVMKTLKAIQAKTPLGWFCGCAATFFCSDPRAAIRFGDTLMTKVSTGTAKFAEIAGHIGTFFLNLGKAIPIIGRFVRVFAFIGKALLWIIKIIAKVYAWIMDKVPELMAALTFGLIEWMDQKAMDQAYEQRDDNYMNEYWQAEHNLFYGLGWGLSGLEMIDMVNSLTARLKGAAKAKGKVIVALLWVTYQGGRWLRGKITDAGVANVNAIASSGDATIGDMKLAYQTRNKITDTEKKKKLQELTSYATSVEPDVSDIEKPTASWENDGIWFVGRRIGEAWSASLQHDSNVRGRKEESKRFITEAVERIANNKFLPEQQQKDLMKLLEICVKEQGYLNRHPWGVAVFNAIRSLSNNKGTNDEQIANGLLDVYRRASSYCTGKAKPNNTDEEALQYVWSKCKLKITDIEAHITNIIENKKQAETARETVMRLEEQRKRERNINIVHESTKAKENKTISGIDNIFDSSYDTGVVVSKAFENAHVIFNDYLSDHNEEWPDDGVYEYGNALFAIVTFEVKKKPVDLIACKTRAMKSASSFIADRYKAETKVEINDKKLPVLTCKHNDLFKPVECKELVAEGHQDDTWYYYAAAFLKTDIVPAPVVTKVDTAAVRAAAPQGEVKKPELPKESKGPDLVTPAPLPESVKPKPKDTKPKVERKTVMAGNVLLPCEGETKEEYDARLKEVSDEYMRRYAEPALSYYTKFGRKEAIQWVRNQKSRGIDIDAEEVKSKVPAPAPGSKEAKDPFYGIDVYAKNATLEQPKPQETAKTETKPKEAPATPTPVSVQQQAAPEVKPTSMQTPPSVTAPQPTKQDQTEDWRAKFEAQQGELNALKQMLQGESPTANLLRQLVELQAKNNQLTEANGETARAQTDVFGRTLDTVSKQKPQVVVMPTPTGNQPAPYTPPATPLNIRQAQAQ